MMAIRSEAVIWVFRNFWAAVWARIWSWIGMEVMSKNITIRRLSLYLMSPAFPGAIWLAAAGFSDECSAADRRGRPEPGAAALLLQLLKFEEADLLRLAVFQNGEIAGLQVGNRLAVLAPDDDVFHHQPGRGLN